MKSRGVTEEGVEHVLVHYHKSSPAQPRVQAKPAHIYVGDYEGRPLKVYVEEGTDPPLVKTVAWADE